MTSILIVEDVEEMRTLFEHMISEIPGLRAAGARNVWEARLELGRRKPDLMILDEVLPGESSLDLLEEARAMSIPVLLVTGVEEPAHEVPVGAAGRVSKPSWESLERDRERYRAWIAQVLTSGSLSS